MAPFHLPSWQRAEDMAREETQGGRRAIGKLTADTMRSLTDVQ